MSEGFTLSEVILSPKQAADPIHNRRRVKTRNEKKVPTKYWPSNSGMRTRSQYAIRG
jgi:hypothetical protein